MPEPAYARIYYSVARPFEKIFHPKVGMNSFTQQNCAEVFVAIASQQVTRQVAFYSQFLSISPKPATATYAEFRWSGLRLAIFTPNEQNAAEFSAVSSGPMSLCLEVDDLMGAIAHLKNIGHAPPGDVMQTSHGQEIYAYDPDGNRLILHQSPS